MCCLFGILDYGNTLTIRQRTKTLSILATACEARGTDATGIAYNTRHHLTIYKRPLAARAMRFQLPNDANVIMGHTRMATQGDEKKNFNNHPFSGYAGGEHFALAHNGVLYNDTSLQLEYRLPMTKIETDSYVAVQLLEKFGSLSELPKMAELLLGTFNFTLLDEKNNLYLVKGNNPLCLYHWKQRNLYLYASTEEILKQALQGIPYHFGIPERIEINEGDIMRIDSHGNRSLSHFSTASLGAHGYYGYPYLYNWDGWLSPSPTHQKKEGSYSDLLKSMAHTFGYTAEDVEALLADGFTP